MTLKYSLHLGDSLGEEAGEPWAGAALPSKADVEHHMTRVLNEAHITATSVIDAVLI